MVNYVNLGWVIFLIGFICYIWVKHPSLPKGSGKNAEWIHYDVDLRRWRRYAYFVTLFCIIALGLIALQVGII